MTSPPVAPRTRGSRRRGVALAWAVTIALVGSGCTNPGAPGAAEPAPPPTGDFDYQLGGPYSPPAGTLTVVRDATAPPAADAYGICYLNGFQSQPGEATAWGGLLLVGPAGPVADPGWPDELLLDTSTQPNRERIAARMGQAIEGCARSGFDAVELDNLDSYLRSDGALTASDNLALAELYVSAAHEAGLAVGQKNAAELVADGVALGFDFALTEECGAYRECGVYEAAYDVVLDVEYADAETFEAMCRDGVLPPGAIRRDRELTTPADPGYVLTRCP